MIELREYQKPIAERVFAYMRNNPGKHPLVAMPTGSGKTIIIAHLISEAMKKYPDTKILVLSHVKEILEQDKRSIEQFCGINVALYSAGMGSKDIGNVTVAGIQSAYRNAEAFKDFKLIIIDECHLIPPSSNSMYRSFFEQLNNPRYFGLTATPYRLGSGKIYGQDDSIFSDLIYDLTTLDRFNNLIKEGYLCKLKAIRTEHELDTSEIRTVGGDFDLKQMSVTFDREGITNSCVREIIRAGSAYKKWLIFAIDIDHAEHIAEEFIRNGITAMAVHSKLDISRDVAIEAHKRGEIKALVNVNVLTTGYDDPEIDLIAILRPTKSPVIHVQTIGRGLRVSPGKTHCLVLDFAGNTARLGPINDMHIEKRKKTKGGGEPIVKTCPSCDAFCHPSTRVCEFCGHEFQFKTNLSAHAQTSEIIRTRKGEDDTWFKVSDVLYSIHEKRNSPDMLKVTYLCGLRNFKEFICLEHPGYAGRKATWWIKYRGGQAATAQEALDEAKLYKRPSRIKVDTRGKYPAIVDYSF